MNLLLSGPNSAPSQLSQRPGPLVDLGHIGLDATIGREGHVELLDAQGERFPINGGPVLTEPLGPNDYLPQAVADSAPTGPETAQHEPNLDSLKARLDSHLASGNMTPDEHRRVLETVETTVRSNLNQ